MSLNDDLKEWNDTIEEGQRLAADIRRDVMRRPDGIMRRLLLRLLRFTERWIERGKRWRNEDMRDT